MVHLSGMGNLIIWMLYVVSLVMKKSSCYEIKSLDFPPQSGETVYFTLKILSSN